MEIPADSLHDPEQLAWLRALARRLVSDDAEADDLAQETWLRLRSAKRAPGQFRPWARRSLTNLLRRRVDSERRRRRREHGVSRAEARPSSLEELEKLELHRELLAAVRELPPRLRRVIVLRFLEGWPPRAIAARLGVPVRNVESRLRRALEALRGRLDENHGKRAAWIALWSPTASPRLPAPASPIVSIGTLMTTKAVLFGVATLVGLVILLHVATRTPTARDLGNLKRVTEAEQRSAGADIGVPQRIEDRVALEQVEHSGETTTTATADPDRRTVRARVIDQDRRPVAGVRMAMSPEVPELQAQFTDGEGIIAFAFGCRQLTWEPDAGGEGGDPNHTGNPQLLCAEPGWTTVFAGRVIASVPGTTECTVGVVRARSLVGSVRSAGGEPLPPVELLLVVPERALTSYGITDTSSVERLWRTHTDSYDEFAFESAPRLEGVRLHARARMYEDYVIEVPIESDEPLELVLERALENFELRGRVVHADGTPAQEATVLHDRGRVRCDDAGEFVIAGHRDETPTRLTAIAQGSLPAELHAAEAAGRPAWSGPIELRLGSQARSMRGVVLDAEGRPADGCTVWVAEPTIIEGLGRGLASLEPMIGGQKGLTLRTKTDSDGRFHLSGLLDRVYAIHALDSATLEVAARTDARAGEQDVTLRFAATGLVEEVVGRTVDHLGRALPHVQLRVLRTTNRMGGFEDTAWGAATESDEDGTFRFAAVAREGTAVQATGERVFACRLPLHELRAGEELVLEVPLECRVRIETDPQVDADAWALEVPQLAPTPHSGTQRFGGALHDGVSATAVVPDTARWLLLFRGNERVDRIPVHLHAGELNVIRP